MSASECFAPYIVAALYQFHPVAQPAALQAELRAVCQAHQLRGTLIVAAEGINGTLAGPRAGIDALREALLARGFNNLEYKESGSQTAPFQRLKIKLKPEIVTLGQPTAPRSQVGRYVAPRDWNALLAEPGVILIDTRNDYEYQAGTFEHAVNPHTRTFREFPAWAAQHLPDPQAEIAPKIAMFCTGGIRCEKATSYLLAQGFSDVYHLKGGILAYLEQVDADQSRYQGECFVFDERVTLAHGLQPTATQLCSCGWPLTAQGACPQCAASSS